MSGIAGAAPIPLRFLLLPQVKLSLTACPISALSSLWAGKSGSKEIPSLQACGVGSVPISLCLLTALPVSAGAFLHRMLQCGEVAW